MKFVKTLTMIAAVMALSACSRVSVPAGYAGVKYNLYGSEKGIQDEAVGPGKYWLTMNEEIYQLPTFSQNYVWTKDAAEGSPNDESITFQDREGTQINADVGITYSIPQDKVPTVFQKYRRGADEITDTYLRNMVRDAINSATSKMDIADIYGPKKEALMLEVTKSVQEQVAAVGIVVEKIYWISAMRLPPTIANAINAKIEATQKAQQRENDLQTAKAQAEIARETARGEADAKIIAAKAEAEANRLRQASITKDLIEYEKVNRWNGELPKFTGPGQTFMKID